VLGWSGLHRYPPVGFLRAARRVRCYEEGHVGGSGACRARLIGTVRPATISDAIAAAAEPGAAYLAAGTNLLDLMKGGITRPNRLVDVTRLPGLDRIERLPDGGMRIGALVRNADLAHDPDFARSYLYAYTFDRLTKAVGALLDRAIAAGEIRSDIGPEDLLRALVGMCYMHDQPGWQATVLRLVDVFVDGLCVQASVDRQTTVSRRGGVTESVTERPPRRGSRKRRE
jgi:FAD binding domain in molybdopterin dehydrogenase/Tetracyclin repressor-like, C-terminal domain